MRSIELMKLDYRGGVLQSLVAQSYLNRLRTEDLYAFELCKPGLFGPVRLSARSNLPFHQSHQKGKKGKDSHAVRHFWLCTKCSEKYSLEYRKGRAVVSRDGSSLFSRVSPRR